MIFPIWPGIIGWSRLALSFGTRRELFVFALGDKIHNHHIIRNHEGTINQLSLAQPIELSFLSFCNYKYLRRKIARVPVILLFGRGKVCFIFVEIILLFDVIFSLRLHQNLKLSSSSTGKNLSLSGSESSNTDKRSSVQCSNLRYQRIKILKTAHLLGLFLS